MFRAPLARNWPAARLGSSQHTTPGATKWRTNACSTRRTFARRKRSHPSTPRRTPSVTAPCHIGAGTGLIQATSAPGQGSPPPHRRRDRALSSPQPLRRRDWAHPCHICSGTGLAPPASARTGTGLACCSCCHNSNRGPARAVPAASEPRPGSPLPHHLPGRDGGDHHGGAC